MGKPGESHLRATKELLRYLSGTVTYGLNFDCSEPSAMEQLLAYADASWGTAYDGKSYTGWLVKCCGGAFTWTSTVQKCTALSTMESELIAACELSRELAWLEKLWEEVVGTPQVPILYCDNEATIDIILRPKDYPKTKHIKIRYFYVRNDMVLAGKLKLEHIPGTDQTADILTKQLPYDQFQKLRKQLGLEDIRG
jgi:hypothetical protein